jgi:hypothetical protein
VGIKRLRLEAENLPPAGAEFKKVWSYTSNVLYTFMAWCSVKAQGQLQFYLLFQLSKNPGLDPL